LTDDVQKILDAISLSQDFTLALYGDEGAVGRLLTKTDLPESVKKFITKPKDVEKVAETPKPEGPQRADFKSDLEFAKAVLEYEGVKVKKSEADEKALIAKIKAELEPELGAAIKKSLAPPQRAAETATVDLAKAWSNAEGSINFREMLYKGGVQ